MVAKLAGILSAFLVLTSHSALAGTAGSDTTAFQHALEHGVAVALVASYGFGVATSLTPCVYPMIAITVSVFGAKEATSRLEGVLLSATFVLGVVCLFTPMGVASAMTGRGFGSALGNPWVVSVIAIVFATLAASLFGAFELALPASVNNRLATAGGAGYRGAFVLGLLCGLVAAPCVGPFLFGLLGWIATTRDVTLGSAAMVCYGLGLGTLFFAVGAFAVNLPKAGAWMMGIKWLGGVALAYMALAYVRDGLRPGALVGALQGETVPPLVGASALVAGVLLAGIHVAAETRRSPIARFSRPAKLASVVPAVAGVFVTLTWWQGQGMAAASDPSGGNAGLQWESSEASALGRASEEHKPLLVDFGARWCGACKELEEKTFPDARVVTQGRRFVALHVDATDDDDAEVGRLRRKYGALEGLPVLVAYGTDGKEALRLTEFVPPARLAEALAVVR
jgi:thiol:disulfide interchange protein DsbD